jgi:hypothetical protein
VDQFARRCAVTARQAAKDAGVGRQERLRRQRCISRWVDPNSGMCITRIALDPLTDATMWQAINSAVHTCQAEMDANRVEPPPWGQLAVDVTVGLITGAQPSIPGCPKSLCTSTGPTCAATPPRRGSSVSSTTAPHCRRPQCAGCAATPT